MSIAAVNQSPGVPIVPEQWGEIPYFLRKSRQNAGIDLKFECRDALPAPLPARIAELGFFSIREILLRQTGAERHYSRSLRVRRLGLCVFVWHGK